MGINLQRSGKQTYSDKPDLSASTGFLVAPCRRWLLVTQHSGWGLRMERPERDTAVGLCLPRVMCDVVTSDLRDQSDQTRSK